MKFSNKKYKKRLVDDVLKKYLKVFPAISLEGPKWCGKTWAATNVSKSFVYLDDEDTYKMADLDIDLIFKDEFPELIDEWNLIPKIWDRVRRKADENNKKGRYILTCSTTLNDEKNKKVFHSGAGRIAKIKMSTMSLYESGDSSGQASLLDMKNNKQKNYVVDKITLKKLASLIIRGGWPDIVKIKHDEISIQAKNYIDSILDKDINDDKKRDKRRMLLLLRTLARNESTLVNVKTIIRDMKETDEKDIIENEKTVFDYLNVLERLYVTENQEAYTENYRSKDRVGKTAKKHFTDPSLAAYLLNMNVDKLCKDLNTFGFLFESLVERDLRIYMENLGGRLCHFRDNVTGLEVDSILEFDNGDYAMCEIKLGANQIEEAKKNLLNLKSKMKKKPKFMCIILGIYGAVVKDKETGIYILPLNSLKN